MNETDKRLLELTAKEKEGSLVGLIVTAVLSTIGSAIVGCIYNKYTNEKTEILIERGVQNYLESKDSEDVSENEES